ncbi:MAG: hypothetical protein WCP79_07415 [Bacillota bacterium]
MLNWRDDLNQLAKELPLLHKNLFFNHNRERFFTDISSLIARLNELDNPAIVMEIARIIANIGDAHTSVTLPQFNRLPFECYWFEEGLFSIEAHLGFSQIVQHKLVEINSIPIALVIEWLVKVIPHENKSFLYSQLPKYLVCADILFGLGLIDDVYEVEIKLENKQGERYLVRLPIIKYADWQTSASETDTDTNNSLPLYRTNKDKYFWKKFIPEKKLLYLNYNTCKDMVVQTVREFTDIAIEDITANPEIQHLVVDIRNNGGGNSELLKPFLQWLSRFQRFNKKNHLFVIVGRDTFSSALLNAYYFKFNTKAVFVGEPTGGKPNCYGEVKYLQLDNSGLYIRYSTKYYQLVSDDRLLSFLPDKLFPVKFSNYQNNIDSCVDWIYRRAI